eukprot:6394000-Amphidinium_carterae.2
MGATLGSNRCAQTSVKRSLASVLRKTGMLESGFWSEPERHIEGTPLLADVHGSALDIDNQDLAKNERQRCTSSTHGYCAK